MDAEIEQKFRILNMLHKNVSLDFVLYFSGFFWRMQAGDGKPDSFWNFSPGSGKWMASDF